MVPGPEVVCPDAILPSTDSQASGKNGPEPYHRILNQGLMGNAGGMEATRTQEGSSVGCSEAFQDDWCSLGREGRLPGRGSIQRAGKKHPHRVGSLWNESQIRH